MLICVSLIDLGTQPEVGLCKLKAQVHVTLLVVHCLYFPGSHSSLRRRRLSTKAPVHVSFLPAVSLSILSLSLSLCVYVSWIPGQYLQNHLSICASPDNSSSGIKGTHAIFSLHKCVSRRESGKQFFVCCTPFCSTVFHGTDEDFDFRFKSQELFSEQGEAVISFRVIYSISPCETCVSNCTAFLSKPKMQTGFFFLTFCAPAKPVMRNPLALPFLHVCV